MVCIYLWHTVTVTATVHTHGKTPNVIESKLQQDGNNTKLWCKQNKMEINYDKTTCTCMIEGTQQWTKIVLPLNICIDGKKIKDVKNRNYLVSTLTKIFAGQIILTTFALISHPKLHYWGNFPHILHWSPKMFYQGYIVPLIDYGSSTWGTTSKSNLKILSKLQKRAARIILNAPYDTASSVMFNSLGWSTIEKRHSYNKAVLTYKALNNLTPLYITELLIPMSQTHNRTLRSTSNGSLAVPRSKQQ